MSNNVSRNFAIASQLVYKCRVAKKKPGRDFSKTIINPASVPLINLYSYSKSNRPTDWQTEQYSAIIITKVML